MSIALLSTEALERALHIRDLMDETQGTHAMQLLLKEAHETLARTWGCRRIVYRSCPVVGVSENYDLLLYPKEGVARDTRYSRYVSPSTLLRTHATAAIPVLLRSLAEDLPPDLLLVVPALCYRRDLIDKIHVGEPHQLDLWRVSHSPLGEKHLREMVRLLVAALLPGREHQLLETIHPYTSKGYQIDVKDGERWVEIGECGLAREEVLAQAGLPGEVSALAMGLGLDRILMLRKGIPDIRLLRAEDPRIASQLLDLAPYRAVSRQPAIARDLSIAVPDQLTGEELGDIARSSLGDALESLEDILVLSETPYEQLPLLARERMGMSEGQKNVLLRLVIRHLTRTLASEEANMIRDRVYLALHRGTVFELANR